MVAAGEATVEEIDASIAFGPGLRWALMGPCLTFHLAGGGGMAHMLDHYGRSVAELERLRDGFLAELLVLAERYAVTSRARPAGERAHRDPDPQM